MKNDKKNILMCYHSSSIGGVENHILDIIEGLSKDFNIYVMCPDGELVQSYLKKGAVKHINSKPTKEFDFKYISRVKNISKKYNIDVIHTHELKTGVLATLGGYFAGVKKRIYHVHTPFSQWKYEGFKKYYAIPMNTFANMLIGNLFATDVIALNKTIAKHRNKKEHIRKNKIRIIPNGLRLNEFVHNDEKINEMKHKLNIRKHDYVIGNISRFTEEKGHKRLLESFTKFLSIGEVNSSNIKLILAGSGKLKQEMEELVSSLGVNENVIFTGKFDDDDKSSLLSIMDMFVFPTYAEGFGYVMLEAFASKIPVLTSNIDVLKEIAGENIKYFQNDKEDFSNEMHRYYEYLLVNENKQKTIKNEFMIAKKYDIQNFWEKYKELYSS